MKSHNRHNLKHMKEARRALRRNSTLAERKLWQHLRNKQMKGKKFRRQHSYGNYILDFYCYEINLAIEVDGAHHFTSTGQINDLLRSETLAEAGIRIVRFENRMVLNHLDEVLETIRGMIGE